MAKVRVYELAKELNLESKALVEKLQAGGMDIKNYMSTLDEDAIKRAKEVVSGGVSKVEVIEEKRVKPTVIRRRKKVKVEEIPAVELEEEAKVEEKAEVEEEAEVEETAVKAELPPEEIKEQEAAVEEVEPSEDIEEEPQDEEKEVPEEKAEPQPPAEKEKTPKKGKKKKVEKAAKIIKTGVKIVGRKDLPKTVKEKPDKPLRKTKAHPPIPKPQPVEGIKEETGKEAERKSVKKKKVKKKVDSIDLEKKGSFRRKKKEVYERADLYAGRGMARKPKKGSKKGKADGKKGKQTEITVPKAIKRRIKVPESVTVVELGKAMGTKG